MKIRQAVMAYLIHKNKIIFVKKKGNDVWELPAGGIENGETPKQSFYREMKEELNISSEHIHDVTVTDEVDEFTWPDNPNVVQKNQVIIAHVDEDADIEVDGEEIEEYDLVSKDEARTKTPWKNKNDMTKKVIETYIASKNL